MEFCGNFCEIIKSTAFYQWDDGTLVPKEKTNGNIKNLTEAMNFKK
jgi:hypothetical protein